MEAKKKKKCRTAIAWTDLTMRSESLFKRKPKVILNRLCGFAEFGSLTAVMGPSGCGLTSLLKCLNGDNNRYLAPETTIRLSSEKINSAFIGHNEKEFLIMALTAKQNMIYASRLKNSSIEDLDHSSHVQHIMAELLIDDTMDTKAENCSGGEQKRLAIGLELTAVHKPNLILCDEPTTGLDSNVAEVVVQNIRDLAVNHNICIIASIHQPNSDIMQMIDDLYVLAKGGVCLFAGPVQCLTQHMRDCGLVCTAYQVPIEHLVTVASKGLEDRTVTALANKTHEDFRQNYRAIIRRTKVKRIEPTRKAFSWKELRILLERGLTIIRYSEWRSLCVRMVSFCLSAFLVIAAFDKYIGRGDDCFSWTVADTRTCFEFLAADNKVEHNHLFVFILTLMMQMIQAITSVAHLDPKYKTFRSEHRNNWYSAGVFYMSQAIMDLIPTTVVAFTVHTMAFHLTHQDNHAKRFWTFVLSGVVSHNLVESFAYFSTFLIPNYVLRILTPFALVIVGALFGGLFISHEDMPSLFDWLSNLTTIKFIGKPMLVSIYGFDRCPKNMTSKTLFEFGIKNDDLYAEYTGYALLQVLLIRFLALITLLMTTNGEYLDRITIFLRKKIFKHEYHQNRGNHYALTTFNPGFYDNPIAIDIDGNDETQSESNESQEETDSENSSTYHSVFENDSELFENEDNDQGLSIAWLDLTLKVEKTFYSNEKLILRGIKGFVRFGALTALMGPSGAGKTSLLRSLNGMYKTLMTKESKIFLSNSRKIQTCFIAQDQREHIINGLSVYQTLLYASKLKNIGYSVDHELNIRKLMVELSILDIKSKTVHKCSAGQQKRIVMAMELTAKVKPNLICVDEPTSGVDSYSALLMIKCFKSIAHSHSLSIITSIHQPNLEILMMYDMLYVLAKGGLTVFSGRPQRLRRHLNECQIMLNDNQIPIEVLLKIGANGHNDPKVLQLSEKTNESLVPFEARVDSELNHFPNGIPFRMKKFSLEEFYHLMCRTVIYILRYQWIIIVGTGISILAMGATTRLLFHDQELGRPDSCVPIVSNSTEGCLRTPESMIAYKVLRYSAEYLTFNITPVGLVFALSAVFSSRAELKIFFQENRNRWYSCESFYLVKLVLDHIPITVNVALYSLMVTVNMYDDFFWAFYLANLLFAIICINFAVMIAIVFDTYFMVGMVAMILYFMLYTGTMIPSHEFADSMQKVGNVSPAYFAMGYLLAWLYGDRCDQAHVSSLLYKFKIDPDDGMARGATVLVFQMVLTRLTCYFLMKIVIYYDVIVIKLSQIAERLRRDL